MKNEILEQLENTHPKTKEEYIRVVKACQKAADAMKDMPRACASCEFLLEEGYCFKFKTYPPLDFLLEVNTCEEFDFNIPF